MMGCRRRSQAHEWYTVCNPICVIVDLEELVGVTIYDNNGTKTSIILSKSLPFVKQVLICQSYV